MTEHFHTRRTAIITALAAGAGAALTARANAETKGSTMLTGHEHDFDWLVGDWKVRHHRLKERLMGSNEWEDFDGTSKLWLTLGGLGTVDDNLLELPAGTYRAVGIRAFDPDAKHWSIWWLDARKKEIDPPVKGNFKDGMGEFIGDDTLRGMPVKVRFRWTKIDTPAPHWEQAFSPDGGKTWEDNWHMDFRRA